MSIEGKTEGQRIDRIMSRMGFAPTDEGPMVSKLRGEIARQVYEHGLVDRSAGTWAPEYGPAGMKLSSEERAKAFLEIEWAIQQGHYHEVRNLDSGWKRPASKIGDWFRSLGFHARVMRSRLLGRRNPYSR